MVGLPADAAQVKALVGEIEINLVSRYISTACTTVLVSDYLHTLPDEVKFMWRASLSPMKVLFLLVRYVPFVHTFISVWHFADLSLVVNDSCVVPFAMCCYSTVVVYLICDAIIYIRVYAFSGRRKCILVLLVFLYLGVRIAQGYLMHKFAGTVRFASLPPDGVYLGCLLIGADTLQLTFLFLVALVSLGAVTLLMICVAWQRRHDKQGPTDVTGLFRVFVQDGIMYFISLLTLGSINIMFDRLAPQNGTQAAMNQIHVHANAILVGRMLLHLREFSQRDLDVTASHNGSKPYED